jgi:hypothetical protein
VVGSPRARAHSARPSGGKYGPPPPRPARPEAGRLARLAAAAERLAEACAEEESVPRALARRAADLAGEIEALLGD